MQGAERYLLTKNVNNSLLTKETVFGIDNDGSKEPRVSKKTGITKTEEPAAIHVYSLGLNKFFSRKEDTKFWTNTVLRTTEDYSQETVSKKTTETTSEEDSETLKNHVNSSGSLKSKATSSLFDPGKEYESSNSGGMFKRTGTITVEEEKEHVYGKLKGFTGYDLESRLGKSYEDGGTQYKPHKDQEPEVIVNQYEFQRTRVISEEDLDKNIKPKHTSRWSV